MNQYGRFCIYSLPFNHSESYDYGYGISKYVSKCLNLVITNQEFVLISDKCQLSLMDVNFL